jgi:hypothetical protein
VSQQGTPPRRSSRQPDPELAGRYERTPRQDRPRRAERPARTDRAGWQQTDAFAPDSDAEVPPWAGPSVYQARPSPTVGRRAPAGPRPDEGGYGDGYQGDVDDYGWADRGEGADSERAEGEWADRGESAGGGESAGHGGRRREPGRPARPSRRRGRAAAARLRKSRRRVYRWCGVAIVACVAAAVITALVTHHTPKPALYVTSLQPGEFKSVPDACSSVSTSVLDQYLPGPGRASTEELTGATDSQCGFTVDHKPDFLLLEVTNEAYQPFPAASGDGSATANAQDNFTLARLNLAHPAQKSPLPPAQISPVGKLGQQAFMAFQREHVTGIVTDVVTVVVRERNALITVALSGQESGHGFGPVPVATLQAGAMAAARNVLAQVLTQPTA